jgi:hypothetical protein
MIEFAENQRVDVRLVQMQGSDALCSLRTKMGERQVGLDAVPFVPDFIRRCGCAIGGMPSQTQRGLGGGRSGCPCPS